MTTTIQEQFHQSFKGLANLSFPCVNAISCHTNHALRHIQVKREATCVISVQVRVGIF